MGRDLIAGIINAWKEELAVINDARAQAFWPLSRVSGYGAFGGGIRPGNGKASQSTYTHRGRFELPQSAPFYARGRAEQIERPLF